jgi:demethylmenaquinone methyltransferase / 2-methoxy-6-polyprenyl-1,4-benzoquinol methylase
MRPSRDERPQAALPPHPTLSGYYRKDEDRPEFVRRLFDAAARDYDHIEWGMALGFGRWYRREALRRCGLFEGLNILDVAVGTGLVAREAARITGDARLVTGLDPSAGMLLEARRQLPLRGVLGTAERLPIRGESFDMVSLGYALRHLSDLTVVFREFARVLRPGGTLCVLELTRPTSTLGLAALRLYLHRVVPLLTRLRTHNREAEVLMRYFWDTIEACVPPERIMAAMDDAGFEEVQRALVIGLFSEYTGRRPGPRRAPSGPARKRDRDNFFVRRMGR